MLKKPEMQNTEKKEGIWLMDYGISSERAKAHSGQSEMGLPTENLTLKQRRCQHCAALTEQEEKWYCDEVQKPVEEIEDCPEGSEILEELHKR